MPIDYADYNPDWKAISHRIRFERAGGHCEKCGVENYALGYWIDGVFQVYKQRFDRRDGKKLVKIILTVAHLDHNTRNDDDSNLMALCQRCHLNHDRADNARRRKYGKNSHKIQLLLFDE